MRNPLRKPKPKALLALPPPAEQDLPQTPLAELLADLMRDGPNAAAERLQLAPDMLPGLGLAVQRAAIATALHHWVSAGAGGRLGKWGPGASAGYERGCAGTLRFLPTWPKLGAAIGMLTDLQGGNAGAAVYPLVSDGTSYSDTPVIIGTALGCVLKLDELIRGPLAVVSSLNAALAVPGSFDLPVLPVWVLPDPESFASFEPHPAVTRVLFCHVGRPPAQMAAAAERIGDAKARMVDLTRHAREMAEAAA